MNKGLIQLCLALSGIFAVIVLVPWAASVLIVGERLATIHPILEWAFYVVIIGFIYALLIRPIMLVLFAPGINLGQLQKLPYQTKMALALRLCRNDSLSTDARAVLSLSIRRKGLLDEPILDAIANLDETAHKKVDAQASLVFVSNTIIQNGRLEGLALISANIRLVSQLIEHYGFRPSFRALLRIYSEVFVAAFLVEEFDELDIDSALAFCGSPALAAIPGFGLIAHSLVQGATSAIFTLRVGAITRILLKEGVGDSFDRRKVRMNANIEARSRVFAVLPGAMSKLSAALTKRFLPASS